MYMYIPVHKCIHLHIGVSAVAALEVLDSQQEIKLERGTVTCLDAENLRADVRRIDASENRITTLQKNLSRLTQLEELILDRNCIKEIPSLSVIRKFPKLKLLSLCCQVEKSVLGFHNDYKTLRSIDTWLSTCSGLRELYLSHNKISEVPEDLKCLSNLKVLELSNNQLQRIPGAALSEWTNMEYLNLGCNRLLEIPDEIGRMRSLRVLRVSDNSLRQLPSTLCRLNKLQTLTLSKNRLVALPFGFHNLSGLMPGNSQPYYVRHLNTTFRATLRLGENPKMIYPPLQSIGETQNEVDVENVLEIMRQTERSSQQVELLTQRIRKIIKNSPWTLYNPAMIISSKFCGNNNARCTLQRLP